MTVNRLTEKKNGFVGYKDCFRDCKHPNNGCDCINARAALHRLAAYEDTGLTPEEITKLVQFREQVMNGELLSIPGVSIRRLSELSEAEREGRLVVLPCKVGDTVYEPFAGKVYEKTVDRIIINRFTTPQIWIETKLPFATPRLERWDMAFGKTVFLTRAEAEEALKEAQHE